MVSNRTRFFPFALPLSAFDTGDNRALDCSRLRMGFGGPEGKVVKLRNLHLRPQCGGCEDGQSVE